MSEPTYLEVLRQSFESRYGDQFDVWTGEAELARTAKLLLDAMPHRRGLRILDIGAGSGRDAAVFVEAGCRYTGIDLVEVPAWAAVRKRWGKAAEFHVAPLQSWSYAECESFDGVLDNGCFHHQHPSDFECYLRRVWELMKPGGLLAINVFTPPEGAAAGHTTFIDRGRMSRYFTPDELRGLLESCQLTWLRAQTQPRTLFPGRYLLALARKGAADGK